MREIKAKERHDVTKKVTVELSLLEIAAIYAEFGKTTTEDVYGRVYDKFGKEVADYIGVSNNKIDVPYDIYAGAKAILRDYGLLEGRD
jgi:UDP-N-acetylmuramyl pentapeptide synthase